MASPALGSRDDPERLPPGVLRLFVGLDEDPRLEGKGLGDAFASSFPDLPDAASSLAATEAARVATHLGVRSLEVLDVTARSCPALLELLSHWLKFRRLCESLPHDSPRMWRLPWESKKFTATRLTKIFSQTLAFLGASAPVGRYWTLHCVRAGAASEASALGLPLPKIRAFGGWGPRSQVPERRYIDPMCPQSAAGRRFFG